METLKKPIKILVIQSAFLGDAILSLPAIQVLKQKNPLSTIDVLCTPVTNEVFRCSPFVDNVIIYDKKGKEKSFFALLRLAKTIKSAKYSKIYSLHRSFRTSLLVFLSEVDDTVGFSNSSFNIIYKTLVPYKLSNHEVKRNIELITFPEQIEQWRIKPIIKIPDEKKNKIKEILVNFTNKKKIVIAPGSIWFTKKYPAEKFRVIVSSLINLDYQIFLIGSKADEHLCNYISAVEPNKIINFAGKFEFSETIELLSQCDLLISNDSAPTHMGMCADIAVLTIYCSTTPEFGFYPYNQFSEYISLNGIDCKPCGIHGFNQCPQGHFKCANDLDEKVIISKAIELVNKNSR